MPNSRNPGYDVLAETALFDSVWVGTESRDYFDSRWGGTPAYQSCFLLRWFEDLTGCNASKFSTRAAGFLHAEIWMRTHRPFRVRVLCGGESLQLAWRNYLLPSAPDHYR